MTNINQNHGGDSNSKVDALPKLLSVREAAGLLGLGYQKTLNLLKYGDDIDCIRIGNCYKVSVESLSDWISRKGKRSYDLKEQ